MSNFYKASYSRGQKRSAIQSRETGSRNGKRNNKIGYDEKIRDDL